MQNEILIMDTSQVDPPMRRLIKNMKGSFFWDFLDFMIEVKESDYDVKILKARKFYVLYHLFEEIIDRLYGKQVKTIGKVVSHFALPAMKSELSGKRILLIDDVLLHGRALEEVYQYLSDDCRCKRENIDLKVYLRNRDRKLIFKEEIAPKRNVNDKDWSWMSCSFVESFMIAGRPYVSVLPYFKISADEACRNKKVQELIGKSTLATAEVQEYNRQKLWIYFGENQDRSLVRIYECQEEQEYFFVPYMFLKPMGRRSIERLVKCLLERHFLEFLSKDFLQGEENEFDNLDDNDYIYLYNVLTYTGSKAFGMQIVDLIEGEQLVKWDDSVEKDGICCHVNIQPFDLSLLQEIFEGAESEMASDDAGTEEADVDEIIAQIQKRDMKPIHDFLELYLSYSGKKDRELADAGQKRMNGLRFSKLMRCVDYENNKWEFWSEVIKEIDLGKGTVIAARSRNGIYENVLYSGEQSFTCGEEYKMAVAYPLISYRNFLVIMGEDKISDEEQQRMCRSLCEDITRQIPKIKEYLSEEELESTVQNVSLETYGDYYSARYYAYEKNSMVQNAMGIVSTYEKKFLEGMNYV